MKCIGFFLVLVFFGCREYYAPPVLKQAPDFLVVDGFLNGTPDSTYIRLSYTRSLNDTAPAAPSLQATVMVEGNQNTLTTLTELGNGVYGNLLSLKTSEKYRLSITSRDGRKYKSDYVPFQKTPGIDSISWSQDTSKVDFYLNTHDPQNNTFYYRWQFEETWQYSTYLTSNFDYVNGIVVPRKADQQIHNCWKSNISPSILLANTSRLSQDVVTHFFFNSISKSSEKIYLLYSVLIRQYALTKDEFEYWSELKRSSEQLGTLFDAQPSQLNSNIHCISNSSEPVLGYLSASTIQRKRIFVGIDDLTNSNYLPYSLPCHVLKDVTTGFSPYDTSRVNEYLYMPNHLFTFWYYDGIYNVAQNFCIDCREHGGTNIKPSFWR
ncbi:MAG: DUF4249 domain-containing protein [Bacteroidota bacterium]|nr:DUF4249 domain-containing protein [Bacteroidota bacterium]